MAIQNFFTSRDNKLDGNTYVGNLGRLWYNPDTNSIYASDGSTPGGIPVELAIGSNISVNTITVNSITSTSDTINLTGNINISGNISPATDTKIGGVKAGPGANISNDGTLTIDTSGLPFSFGDFTANTNILTLVNTDQNMILATKGSAEVQLVGNIGFYKTNGFPPNIANRYFYATNDGTVNSKYLDIQSLGETGIAAPFNVSIDATGNYRPPAILNGTIAQFTGNSGQRSFVVQDNYGIDPIVSNTGGEYTFRTGRGTVDSPLPVQSGDRLASIVAAGWASNGYGGQASGYYRIVANENFTPTARGGRLEMWVVPNGTITETKVVSVDGNELSITGDLSASGNINIPTGYINYTPVFGSWYSNVTQTISSNVVANISVNNTVANSDVSYNAANNSWTINQTDTYNIQVSYQVTKTDNGTDLVEFWLAKNGTNVPWTNTELRLEGNNDRKVFSLNFVESFAAGDTFQLRWYSLDSSIQMLAKNPTTNPPRPGVPSVIVTVVPVGG